ncbi:hypothetical protein ACWGIU_24590 [Streptomyces sp. NPDC054840]
MTGIQVPGGVRRRVPTAAMAPLRQDIGVLDGAERAAAEGRVHGEHQGGAAQQDRRAHREVRVGGAARAFGAGGDAEDERGGSGHAEAGEDVAAAGAGGGVGDDCMA